MNTLQEKRTSLAMTQPQVSAELKKVEPRIDIGMVSRYEKGVYIPTDAQISALEKLYGAHRSDLWDVQDLDLLHLVPEYGPDQAQHFTVNQDSCETETPHKKDLRSLVYVKKCYRVPRKFSEGLPADLFEVCGYSTGQSWFDACLRHLLSEYTAKRKAMKKEASGNAPG